VHPTVRKNMEKPALQFLCAGAYVVHMVNKKCQA